MDIAISSLATDISPEETIELAYREELDWIEDKVTKGLSVLVECDKQLTTYLYRALRKRIKQSSSSKQCLLISGHAQPDNMTVPQSRMQRIINELQAAIFSATDEQIITLPHLDVLTTTTRSGLNMETREAAALLFENPDATFLAFKDPSFELPKVIEKVFTVRRSIIGIARDKLPQIILQSEARKLGESHFNPYRLYKYLSGLNALRCREILSHLQGRLDYDERSPELLRTLYTEIRQMTLVADVELPNVDLEQDIGGYSDVKNQIKREILDLLHSRESLSDPQEVKQLEELIPKGLIFHGPPGTGKTFFCKAMATALDATIIIVSGPELKSKWVGESEENLRRVFAQARRAAPAIIVFDELDSFASARGTYTGSGVEHSMVNQMLTEMDGFRQEELVFVVGTTNFMSSLDPALLRPGRFELNIHIPYPKEEDRYEILSLYQKKFKLELSDEQIKAMARQTGGLVDPNKATRYSGDHLYAIMRSLKREVLRNGEGYVINKDLINKVINVRSPEAKKLTDHERRVISIHESGHAICAYFLPNCATIEEVNVAMDSTHRLGYLATASRENRYVTTKAELLDDICVFLGGRLAEKLILGEVSTGAYDDLQRANEIARSMVEELGMSTKLGLRTFVGKQDGNAVLGGQRQGLSEETARELDQAIQQMISEQELRTWTLLETHRKELELLVDHLIENGHCNLETIKKLFAG